MVTSALTRSIRSWTIKRCQRRVAFLPLTIVLDLDETTGQWGLASFAYHSFRDYTDGLLPPVETFVQTHLAIGGARPYLVQLLKALQGWKASGRVKEVAIFTSASNAEGWVTFLLRCMEEYAGTPGLFGRCFCREDSPDVDASEGVNRTRTSRTSKDLSRVCANPELVWLVDDKPQYASNGRVLEVSEYRQDVPSEELEKAIKMLLPHMQTRIGKDFQVDRQRYPANGVDYTTDEALLRVIQMISVGIERQYSKST